MPFLSNIKKIFRPAKAVVLMYHRIAEPRIDPWQLTVSTENFREHIKILTETKQVISTEQLIRSIRDKKLDNNCFCITSDDAYQDNFLNALPVIEEYACPSTFFIPSGSIGSGEPFWWDIMSDIFLSAKKLPGSLNITINNKIFSYNLENNGSIGNEQISIHSQWHWPQSPPTQRCRIYIELWMHLRDLPAPVINEAVLQMKKWSGLNAVNDSGNFPMSRQELHTMSTSKYVTLGVHTVTHAALGAFSKEMQETEIMGCLEFLDKNIGKNHLSIAFPYGNYNSDTLAVAKQAGMKGAFTTDAKPVTVKSDVYQMGRFQVMNQSGEQFKKQLENWLNN